MPLSFSKTNTFDNFFQKSGVSAVQAYKTLDANQFNNLCLKPVKYSDLNKENFGNKKKIFGIVGVSVGTVALVSLITFFTLSKNFASGFAKKFTKISENIKNIVTELSSRSEKLTPFQKTVLKITKTIQPFVEGMEATANVTAIKDSFVNKFLYKVRMGKFVNYINKFFKDKIVLVTKNNAYKKAELSVVEFCNYLEKIAKKEKIPELEKASQKIMDEYSKSFSVKAHVSRTNKNWEKMSDLGEEVFDILFRYKGSTKEKSAQFIRNVKMMKTYITTTLTAKQRIALKEEVGSAQISVMNTMKDSLKFISEDYADKVLKLYEKADYRLSRAIASEIKSFNKLAEVQVGSVATDILGILVPATIATAIVVNSENKKERIGNTLTKGIPIIGGLGTSYYGSSRGFTGAKNIALGLSTAWMLNIIGVKTNDWYKKYSEKQRLMTKAFESFNKLQSNNEN